MVRHLAGSLRQRDALTRLTAHIRETEREKGRERLASEPIVSYYDGAYSERESILLFV
jgi:thioester reductase-like protein